MSSCHTLCAVTSSSRLLYNYNSDDFFQDVNGTPNINNFLYVPREEVAHHEYNLAVSWKNWKMYNVRKEMMKKYYVHGS